MATVKLAAEQVPKATPGMIPVTRVHHMERVPGLPRRYEVTCGEMMLTNGDVAVPGWNPVTCKPCLRERR